jgi:hypothetical protein
MPILFMALIALAVFLIMGAMVLYAAYSESHMPSQENALTAAVQNQAESPAPPAAVPSVPAVLPAPAPARSMGKAAGRG